MIIKGKSRSGPISLAAHLGNAEKNERVQLLETWGTVAKDLRGALNEMDALAIGTKCEKPLYHAAMSPAQPHRLTPEQRVEAVNALEDKLGFKGHARLIVLHEKHGREHIHVVWSRIDVDRMRSVSDSHNYRKHEEVARDLERRFGHERVQGAHHEREGIIRPDRTPSRSELRQEERTGIKGKLVKSEVTAAFRASDGPEAFRSALQDKGYFMVKGDRRDFILIDRAGGLHSLARRIDGLNAAGLREFMSPLDRDRLPAIDEVRGLIGERQRIAEEKERLTEITRLEKGYGRGDDYVSQSLAALKEHKKRQEPLDRLNQELRPSKPAFDEEQRLTREQEKRRDDPSSTESGPGKTPSGPSLDGVEMTDAMIRMLSRFDDAGERGARDGPPGTQRQAPGGGRTRSR